MFNIYMQDQPKLKSIGKIGNIGYLLHAIKICLLHVRKKNFNVQTKIICIFKKVPKRHYIPIQTVYL